MLRLWLTGCFGDLSKMINESGLTFAESKVSPENLAGMIALIDKGTISGKIAKRLLYPCGNPARMLILS